MLHREIVLNLYGSMDFSKKLTDCNIVIFFPQFSPAVNKALEEKKLTGNRRNELTRDVCSSVRVHTMYPTKAEREHVAFLLVKKFPFLRDAIGSGIVSWVNNVYSHYGVYC